MAKQNGIDLLLPSFSADKNILKMEWSSMDESLHRTFVFVVALLSAENIWRMEWTIFN